MHIKFIQNGAISCSLFNIAGIKNNWTSTALSLFTELVMK